MKKLIVLLGSLSLLAMPLAGCGGDGGDDDPIVTPDAGPAVPDAGKTDAGETDAGETDAGTPDAGETDAGETDAGETDAGETDAGETDAGPQCTPTAEDALIEANCTEGNENDACGTKSVDNGCGETVEINCGCSGALSCTTDTITGDKTCQAECVPMDSNAAYKFYCRHAPTNWVCGGKIKRDDGCGGEVNVNCGTKCSDPATECIMDETSPDYLHCVKTECVPQEETDEAFCARYHTGCGTVTGEDSCNNAKTVDCGGCGNEELCISEVVASGSGSSSYVKKSCKAKPATVAIDACEDVQGDTGATTATKAMFVEAVDGSILYSAPEVIYAYTAGQAGSVKVSATPYSATATEYDLVLYVVDSLDSHKPIKLADDGQYGAGEELTFTATAGKTYYIVVDGGDWSSAKYDRGTFRISIDDGNCSAEDDDKGVVISAIYTGGGTGSGKPECDPASMRPDTSIGTSICEVYKQDYVELHNQSGKPIDINGYSLMKATANNSNGTNWQEIVAITKSTEIPAGGYFLLSPNRPAAASRTIQDLPYVDKENGASKWNLGEAQKIFLSKDSTVTSTTLNNAGVPCPATDAKGFFYAFGANICGTDNAALKANQQYRSADGCSDMTLTDFTVVAEPKEDASHNVTHPITSITPEPRTSRTTANVCN